MIFKNSDIFYTHNSSYLIFASHNPLDTSVIGCLMRPYVRTCFLFNVFPVAVPFFLRRWSILFRLFLLAFPSTTNIVKTSRFKSVLFPLKLNKFYSSFNRAIQLRGLSVSQFFVLKISLASSIGTTNWTN